MATASYDRLYAEFKDLLDAWTEVVSCFDMNVPPATLLGVTFLGYVGQLVEVDAVVVTS